MMKEKTIVLAGLVMLLLSGCAGGSLTMEKQEQESGIRSEENEPGIEDKYISLQNPDPKLG